MLLSGKKWLRCNVGSLLGQRRRRWSNSDMILDIGRPFSGGWIFHRGLADRSRNMRKSLCGVETDRLLPVPSRARTNICQLVPHPAAFWYVTLHTGIELQREAELDDINTDCTPFPHPPEKYRLCHKQGSMSIMSILIIILSWTANNIC